ncbi:MAG: hypothetical protein C0490_12875, partial [Marivirga sp.]|nr:hypothetical protein [Marivirga sp.]
KQVAIGCFFIAFVVGGNSHAQQKEKEVKKTDSYKNYKSRSSVNGADQLLKEANSSKKNNPDEALNKVKEALGLSIAQGDALNEARCYLLISEINENITEWKLALENYVRAYDKLKNDFPSSTEYRRTLQGLGNTQLKLGNFQESLIYYQELLAMRLSVGEKRERQLDISEVYYQMGNYDEALKTLDNITSAKVADPSFEARAQNQRAKIFARTNELEKTKDIYENSINTLRANKAIDQEGEQSLQNAKEEIVDVLREQKRYDDEIDLRKQSIQLNLKSKNLAEVTKDKVEIGKTLAAKGENTLALKEIEEAARMADTLENPREQANAFLALADLYQKSGRNIQALAAYKRYSEAVTASEKLIENELMERSGLIRQQRDIEELTKNVSIGQREETIERATVFRQQLVIYGLLFIVLISGVTSYFTYKNAVASKVANQLLTLKSLRGQMNPHFIFNALNSVNHFIAQKDERTANKFLSEFSQLMRLVLENSQEDFIPLHKEQEILSLYLKLEHYRFRDKFEYKIETNKDINIDTMEVPPMLIQPYIENAVWHGLRYRETKGKLSLHFRKEPDNIVVEIEDNGIGRKRSSELKTENQRKHNSTGLKNIEERLSIINKVYNANYRVTVEDLESDTGTRVKIYLPVNKQKNSL